MWVRVTITNEEARLFNLWIVWKRRTCPDIPKDITAKEAISAILQEELSAIVSRVRSELERSGVGDSKDIEREVRKHFGIGEGPK